MRTILLSLVLAASLAAAHKTARKQVIQPRALDVSEVAQRLKKMLGRLIGEKFEIKMNCPANLPAVHADEGGVEQILMNLVLNARDALPDGGRLLVTLDTVDAGLSRVAGHPTVKPGRFVQLAVADDVSIGARYLHGFPITGANPKDQFTVGANFHF